MKINIPLHLNVSNLKSDKHTFSILDLMVRIKFKFFDDKNVFNCILKMINKTIATVTNIP